MARLSRRRGPGIDFELTAVLSLVTGMTITRTYGLGALLIFGHARFTNASGAPVSLCLAALLDGVIIMPNAPCVTIVNSGNGSLHYTYLEPIGPGIHTIDMFALGDPAANDTLDEDSAELIVIELPAWDLDDDIITL